MPIFPRSIQQNHWLHFLNISFNCSRSLTLCGKIPILPFRSMPIPILASSKRFFFSTLKRRIASISWSLPWRATLSKNILSKVHVSVSAAFCSLMATFRMVSKTWAMSMSFGHLTLHVMHWTQVHIALALSTFSRSPRIM